MRDPGEKPGNSVPGPESPPLGSDTDTGQRGHVQEDTRAPPVCRDRLATATLLTPQDIASRMNISSSDPTRWMRRFFAKHGVSYLDVCGKPRATEEQYQLLMDRCTCSPFAPVEKMESTQAVDRVRSVHRKSKSKSSVQELVTEMLHRT